MYNYIIRNSNSNKMFVKAFDNGDEARQWIRNTLDLSQNWSLNRLDTCEEIDCDYCNTIRHGICKLNLPF